MYTDKTILTFGKYKFTSLCRVPADYLLELYKSGCKDKELIEYIESNMESIKNRAKGNQIIQEVKVCTKYAYTSEKDAKNHLKTIHKAENENKPTRAYECPKCGFWHLTSKPLMK